MMTARRQVAYQWRLREVMAAHGLFNATDLEPLLAERGIHLSSVQVWRLVTGTPERLSLPVLAALCDIFEVTADQLIATTARNTPARKAAGPSGDHRAHPAGLQPVRPPRLSGHELPRRLSLRPLPAHGPGHPRALPRLRHHPATAWPPSRRPGGHLPGLRRHQPLLHLLALRL